MRCAIITAPRPGGVSYVESTVCELARCAPREAIRVFADALDGPAAIDNVPVTYASAEQLARARRLACLGTLNLARAADWVGERGHGCVFEDDVLLAENWLDRAEALAQRAESLYPQGWVLALTHFYRFPVDFHHVASLPDRHVDLLRWKATEQFYGAQAVMLSRGVAAAIGPTIRDNVDADPKTWFADLAIKAFCLRFGIPLLACEPCLAQHVGTVSTFAGHRPPPISRHFRRAELPSAPAAREADAAASPAAAGAARTPPAPISRNAPCFCGSGLRYKACHADPARARDRVDSELRDAGERLARGDADGADAICHAVLATHPDHPGALRVAARCGLERGRTAQALRLALSAAKALQSHPLPAPSAYLVWSELNFVFTQALVGVDTDVARSKRDAYSSAAPGAAARARSALVTVAVVDTGDPHALASALASVALQTWRHIEVVVACAQADPRRDGEVAATISGYPFPIRWLVVPGASEARLADCAIRAGSGEYANILRGGSAFAPSRVATLIEALAVRGGDWGFSGVAFVDADGRPVAPHDDARVRTWSERLAAIPEADTVGYTLIHQAFVAVDASNLLFSRALYKRAGGFGDAGEPWAWAWALRALWLAEPVHVASREYVHRLAAGGASATPASPEQQAVQIAMFRDYYARACREDEVAANPYAPGLAHWRMHFLKAIFHAGHVLALPLAELERLGDALLARLAEAVPTASEPGLNLIGFAYGEFGLAESMRALARACEIGGIPFVVRDVDLPLNTRQADRSVSAHVSAVLKHRCSVFCLNPDMIGRVRPLLVEGSAVGRRNVGYWFWELEHLPREWNAAIDAVDEIWVSTRFIADAMRRATAKPVVLIPHPVGATPSRAYTRTELALPDDRFLFLFSFDFNSFASRKNPEGAIAAFRRAFPPGRRDVGLVIKSINGARQPEKMRAIVEAIEGDERIVMHDAVFTRDQVSGLQTVVDAYVSLHRAEGLGLGLAEAMFHGKPVIGTGYSGNLEFMNADNSCLVDYRLVPIARGEYLYSDERFFWAEPDVEHAAHWMRRLVDDAPFRLRIAERGRQTVRSHLTPAAAAQAIAHRLHALGLIDAAGVSLRIREEGFGALRAAPGR